MNTLYLGDCLYVLRDSVPDESVDLIYIDPPFNSKRDYNIFFDDKLICRFPDFYLFHFSFCIEC